MSLVIDYSRYQTLRITRRGANQTVLDIQMKAGGPGGNGKLPTAGHEGHAEKFRRRIVSNAQPPPGFSNWDAFPPCKLCFGLFQRGDNFPIFAYCELSDRQKRFGCISNDRQLLGICLAQMLKNFKCAHGMKLPRAPPARNSFHGRHNSLVLALRRDPSWTTAQFD